MIKQKKNEKKPTKYFLQIAYQYFYHYYHIIQILHYESNLARAIGWISMSDFAVKF